MSSAEIDSEYAAIREQLAGYLLDGGRLAVVQAPPGSGKTHTLIEVLAELAAGDRRMAVAAQTNSQAEDICKRFADSHPEVSVTRFASTGLRPGDDFPAGVHWVTDKKELPPFPGVTVATTAKLSLTDLASEYDLLAIDEAWQMSWAELMQCATISDRFFLIGDPGQIPPVVAIDVRRWETSPRAPHAPAPEVVLGEPAFADARFVGSLPACRRLPNESVGYVRPFYDFDFDAYLAPGARALEVDNGFAWAEPLRDGRPLALTIPTPEHGPPIEVDHEMAAATARVVTALLDADGSLRVDKIRRSIEPVDIGVTSSHRLMNAALSAAIGAHAGGIRVDTPERWQGLERPVMVAVHPMSGVTNPSAFDLETGRLCVMASRHQVGLILLARDHVGETLRNYVPSAEQAPGRPDVVGRGHDAHLRFWTQLEEAGGVAALT